MTSRFNIQSAATDQVKRFKEPCLNSGLWRSLNPRRNLEMCLIPLFFKQLYVLLGDDTFLKSV